MRFAPSIAAVLFGTACLFANPIAAVAAQSAQRDWSSIEYRKDDYADEATWRRALARAYFDAPVIDACLAMLRNEYVKQTVSGLEYEFGQRIVDTVKKLLDRFIHEEGKDALREEAARRLLNGSAAERQRAELIFTRYEKVPEAVVRRAAASPRLQHRAWAAWCNTGTPGPDIASDDTLFRTGAAAPTFARNPIADVADALRAELRLPPEELARCKQEYQACYRETFEPALARVETHFPTDNWLHVDFDGDGTAELFIAGSVPDGWSSLGQPVTMILRWSREHERWRAAYIRKWGMFERRYRMDDVIVADFDGDGRAELVEPISVVAGWCYGGAYYFDEAALEAPAYTQARTVHVVRLPNDPRPVIVARSAHNPTGGGKASYLVTALASELCVVRRDGPRAESATVLVRGNGW